MSEADDRTGIRWALIATAVGVLAASNLLNNGVLPSWAYVPWNLSVATLLLVMAMSSGVSLVDVGIDVHTWRRSIQIGLIGVALVALVYALALLVPISREAFDDGRVGTSAGDLIYHALFQIPLGTVVLEEVAFRGVVPALLGWRQDGGRERWRPAVAASLLFGLWHVLPAAHVLNQNAAYNDLLGDTTGLALVVAVAVTTLLGLGLLEARRAGRGLLTPVFVHLGTNCLGFFVAWLLARP